MVSPEENSIATAAPHITDAINAPDLSSLPAAVSGFDRRSITNRQGSWPDPASRLFQRPETSPTSGEFHQALDRVAKARPCKFNTLRERKGPILYSNCMGPILSDNAAHDTAQSHANWTRNPFAA